MPSCLRGSFVVPTYYEKEANMKKLFVIILFVLFCSVTFNNAESTNAKKVIYFLNKNFFLATVPDKSFIATQGMCVAGDYLIETHFAGDNVATRYYVIDIPAKSVKGYYDIPTNHSNNLTYNADDGCVYTAYLNSIYKLRLNSDGVLSLEETIPLTGLYAISGIAYSNGIFYVRGIRRPGETHRQIFKTTDFVKYDYLYTVDFGIEGQSLQGMEVDSDFLYMPTSGSRGTSNVFIFDKNTGKRIHILKITGSFRGEIEDIDCYKGKLFINFNRGSLHDSFVYSGLVYMLPLLDNTTFIGTYKVTNRNSYTRNSVSFNEIPLNRGGVFSKNIVRDQSIID